MKLFRARCGRSRSRVDELPALLSMQAYTDFARIEPLLTMRVVAVDQRLGEGPMMHLLEAGHPSTLP